MGSCSEQFADRRTSGAIVRPPRGTPHLTQVIHRFGQNPVRRLKSSWAAVAAPVEYVSIRCRQGEPRWQSLRIQAVAQGLSDAGSVVRWEIVRRPAALRYPLLRMIRATPVLGSRGDWTIATIAALIALGLVFCSYGRRTRETSTTPTQAMPAFLGSHCSGRFVVSLRLRERPEIKRADRIKARAIRRAPELFCADSKRSTAQ